jgi:hypothetical protein
MERTKSPDELTQKSRIAFDLKPWTCSAVNSEVSLVSLPSRDSYLAENRRGQNRHKTKKCIKVFGKTIKCIFKNETTPYSLIKLHKGKTKV